MRRTIVTVGLVVCSLAVLAARPQSEAHSAAMPPHLEWSKFKALYDVGKVLAIDVREPGAFEAGHIPGARSMPMKTLEQDSTRLRKSAVPLVLYCNCAADEASIRGTRLLRAKGLKAFVLAGGYRRWLRETNGQIARGLS